MPPAIPLKNLDCELFAIPSTEYRARLAGLEGWGSASLVDQRCRTAAESQQRKFVLAQPASLEEIDAFVSGK